VGSSKPITVIGGGLAGLTVGIGLRQRGVPVTIWEAGAYPRHRVCGEFISGRGQGVLERLGLREMIVRAGAVLAQDTTFFVGNKMGPVRPVRPPALCLSRFTMDTVLASHFRACGGELRDRARWRDGYGEGIVCASGRRLQPVEISGGWFGLKVHARNVPLAADVEMHSLPDGYVGICRLNRDEVNVCGLFRRAGSVRGMSRNSKGPLMARGYLEAGKRGAAPNGPLCWPGIERTAADVVRAAGSECAWKEMLRGGPDSALHNRLAHAVFDDDSFCSVGGLGLRPRRASRQAECRIGDALTMTPPVTGNGMSMALEGAELALEPLFAYSTGRSAWKDAQGAVARACDRAFGKRLAWAKWLQWIMLARMSRTHLSGLLLSSDCLWRIVFAKTR